MQRLAPDLLEFYESHLEPHSIGSSFFTPRVLMGHHTGSFTYILASSPSHHIGTALALILSLSYYESVDIIGGSCGPYFILFVVFRLSPIEFRLSQFEES